MNSTRNKLLPALCLCLLLLFGCSQTEGASNNQKEITSDEETASYEDYLQDYIDMTKELKLKGYNKSFDNSESPNIVLIDKSVSFGEREILTLNGEQTYQSTQNKIVFTSEESDKVVYLDWIYLSKDIGNDMLFTGSTPAIFEQNAFYKQFDEAILSYKNTLIKVTLFWKDNKEISNLYKEKHNILQEITSYLETEQSK